MDIPDKAYVDTFLKNNLIIPNNSKCCKNHLTSRNTIYKSDVKHIEIVSNYTELNDLETKILLDRIRNETKYSLFEKFSKPRHISNEECKRYTGLNKKQFDKIIRDTPSLKKTSSRNQGQALGVYLTWLKTGLDIRTLSTIFSIDNHQNICNYCAQVGTALITDFVPKYLGVKHLTRDNWVNQNSIMAKELYNVANNELVLIADGTYIYCQKSTYNTLQRKTYSVQKNRHLGKPFVICTPNGRILDVYGLFPTTSNDATIITQVLKSNKDLRHLIKPNDHIVLDRGFRDAITTLETDYKMTTHMPVCVPSNQKQLTTEQANISRFATKTRWIIETINGRIKTFYRANDKVHPNVTMSHTIDDLRITAAILNKFYSDYGTQKINDKTIAINMEAKFNTPNRLEGILESYKLDRKRTDFTKINSSSLPAFPKLSLKELINNITYGPYQLKQASCYINETFSNPEYPGIELYQDKNNIFDQYTMLLRSKVYSRHKSNKIYNSYITHATNKIDYTAIPDWIRTCKSGKRTVGCCSHVARIIYYLSNARYNSSIRNNNLLDKIFTEPVCDDSSDESDTDSDATEVDSDATIIDNDISALGSHTTENVQEMQVNQGNSPSIYPDLSSMNTS